jgi:hypothetical protein
MVQQKTRIGQVLSNIMDDSLANAGQYNKQCYFLLFQS